MATLPIAFSGDVNEGVRAAAAKRLAAGLASSGLRVVETAKVVRLLGTRRCGGEKIADGQKLKSPRCLQKIWVMLGARFVVGARIKGADRSYDVELWVNDARRGTRLAHVSQRCEICGLAALSRSVDLAASSLAAKLAGTARAPARHIIDSQPSGATIELNGKVVGVTPKELTLVPGTHALVLKKKGFRAASRDLRAVSGVQERTSVALVAAVGERREAGPWRTIAWFGLAAGAAALAAGITLLAIDGAGIDCGDALSVPGGQCARIRDTLVGGAVLTGIGAAALLGSAYLFYYTWPGRRADKASASLSVGLGRVALRARF